MTSLLVKIYVRICTAVPGFHKVTKKLMYQSMARFMKQDQWTFMNYGYSQGDSNEIKPELDSSDETNRLSFQLYHHLASEIELGNKVVLEIGSGRGGGASMIMKHFKPGKMVGVDFSPLAVKFCNKNYKQKGLSFVVGDAENLPFTSDSFDTVINVESSHCYTSMKRFLGEVNKVLRPGGHFLFTDFRDSDKMEELEKQLSDSGMKILKKRDITSNVVQALNENHEHLLMQISNSVPKFFIKQFHEFSGVKDSIIYKKFESRNRLYYSYILQKN